MNHLLAVFASTLIGAGAPVTSAGKAYTLPAPPAELVCRTFQAGRDKSDVMKCNTKAHEVSVLIDLTGLRPEEVRTTAKAKLEKETKTTYSGLLNLKVLAEGVFQLGGIAGYRKAVAATNKNDGRAVVQIDWVLITGQRCFSVFLFGQEAPMKTLGPRVEAWLRGLKLLTR